MDGFDLGIPMTLMKRPGIIRTMLSEPVRRPIAIMAESGIQPETFFINGYRAAFKLFWNVFFSEAVNGETIEHTNFNPVDTTKLTLLIRPLNFKSLIAKFI